MRAGLALEPDRDTSGKTMLFQWVAPAFALLLALGWSSAATAAMITLSAKDSLRDPSSGTISENSVSLTSPPFGVPLAQSFTVSEDGGAAEASTQASASYGILKGVASQSIDGTVSSFKEASAEITLSFDDSVTVTGGSGSGTFNATFQFEGGIDALVSSFVDDPGTTDPTFAEASYRLLVTVADGVFEWTGAVSETRPGGPASSIASDLTVGGAPVAGPAGPDFLYTTPDLNFTYGTAFTIAAELEILVAGDDNDTSILSSDSDFFASFIWGGMSDLASGASPDSDSGTDWTVNQIPEPGTMALLACGLALLAGQRRRSHGRAGGR
jgi:hypothetical protein